ncbi:MAG TPA: AAA family ATPase, partial [Fimbriimonadaceae bacterium]|nr:AAA family ATPase [Fimbriimonadaceae bacterium]
MVNPYETSGNGITSPDQFIGRRETLARILEQVVRGESIQIVGPLKIGRTSLLRMIAHPSVGGIHGLDPDRFTVILMDLHELAGRAGAHEFYRWMLSALCDALPEASSSVSTATPFSQLCQALRRLDRIGRRVVFACDNFEFIERLASDPDLLSTLRALASRHASLVVTTLTPLDVLLRPYSNPQTSPLWNVLRRHDLGVYSPEEAELMIRCPQSVWSPESSGTPGRDVLALEWVSRIQGYVGTHPYLLQLACAEVYELQRLEENRFEERHRSLVEDWLEHLSQDARLLLTALRETPPPEWGPILEPQYPRRLLVEGGWLS